MYYKITQWAYLLVFFFLLSTSVQSQSFTPKAKIIGDSTSVYGTNFQVIFPLGWSENGYFAYILQDLNSLSAMDIKSYSVIIQDMKTDKIIWKTEIQYNFENQTDADYNFSWKNVPQEDSDNIYSYTHGANFFKHVFWVQHKTEILNQLTKFKIHTKGLELNNVLALKNEDVTIKEIKNPEKGECTTDYRIDLHSSGKGGKTIFNYSQKNDDEPCGTEYSTWFRGFSIVGYFRSPFENRISLVVFQIKNGLEEPFEYPCVVGASLDHGFE